MNHTQKAFPGNLLNAAGVCLRSLFTICACVLLAGATRAQVKNVVLVHGAWGDVSGWAEVYTQLKAKGYHVDVVSNSNASLADDAASVKAVLARQDGPVVLVGHSYGGAIITQAGDTANVSALVYVAAFAPDAGESLVSLGKDAPQNPAILPPLNGLIWLDTKKFHEYFCQDLPDAQADFMNHSQTPAGIGAFVTPLTSVAWKNKPSWYIVAKQDHMIPPDAERFMAKRAGSHITEVNSSHVPMISHPKEVVAVIEAAAKGGM